MDNVMAEKRTTKENLRFGSRAESIDHHLRRSLLSTVAAPCTIDLHQPAPSVWRSMARGRSEVPPCCKRYGSPLYCANWVPVDRVIASLSKQEAAAEEEKDKDEGVAKESKPIVDGWVVVLGGGGGEGRSGVRNVLLLARFDPATASLSDHPTFRLETEGDLPYRMAVHPGGDGIVCSFPKSCRSFEFSKNRDRDDLALRPSEKPLTQLEDVGLQLALAFSPDGSMLAAGGENGHLRVFKWSSMEPLIDQNDAHTSVKDLDFSSDGKFLVSLGSGGPCRVWDMTANKAVASLPRENGENFGYCRFSQTSDHSMILYITAMQGQHGKIVSWDPLSGKRVGSKKIVRDPICAFTVSPDGKLLAVGTIEGDIVVLNLNLQLLTRVKKAHLGIVTALVFKESRALVSASFDSSARVSIIEGKKKSGFAFGFSL